MIGRSLRRREDARFLTGQGRYIADVAVPGLLHAAFVRSPHAHADLRGIETGAARALPGVHAVLTAGDLAGLQPLPCTAAIPTVGPMRVPPRHALASDRVRHVGAPVVLVVADSPVQALDAAEAVAVEYAVRPSVVDAAAALRPEAPLLWDEAPGNLAFAFAKGDEAATEAALAGSDHVVALSLVNNRITVAPLEHRGAIAEPGAPMTLTLSGSGVHALRDALCAVFGWPPSGLHVVCPDVGGGFGVKNPIYPEYVALLWAARALGRPVRWLSGHGEDFVSTAHGRDSLHHARLGLDGDGRFTALMVETTANLGAAMSSFGPGPSTTAPGNALGCGYAFPTAAMRTRGAFTNTVPTDAYRGAGKPEMNYLVERLIDAAARQTGIDRVDLRRRNLVRAFPHRTAAATVIDGGRFAANIDPALTAADAAGFAARRAASAAAGRLRGLGVTCFLETARGAPDEGAEIRFGADGTVSLHLGTQSNGQGHETSFPQVAADRLGLPAERFVLVQADTRTVRDGNGHGGARSLHLGGAALAATIETVLLKARPVAARLLQARLEEVSFAAGTFRAGERSAGLLEVARAAAEGGEALDSYRWNKLDRITFPNGVHLAEVEVDPDTGAVTLLRYTAADDYGTVVNPMLTVGQVQGGLAQGIGQALLERTAYDGETGQLLSGSFMDYALPRAADLPALDVHLLGTATDANPLGVKGAGQAGAIAAPPAVVAAVLDALAPSGVAHLDMPLTPERVWRALADHAPRR